MKTKLSRTSLMGAAALGALLTAASANAQAVQPAVTTPPAAAAAPSDDTEIVIRASRPIAESERAALWSCPRWWCNWAVA